MIVPPDTPASGLPAMMESFVPDKLTLFPETISKVSPAVVLAASTSVPLFKLTGCPANGPLAAPEA